MKNIIKNFVTALMLSGLFFIPVLSSSQTPSGIVNDSDNLSGAQVYSDKSQAEIEAIEEMLVLEAKSKHRPLYLKDPDQFNSRFFTLRSNVINNNRSQAEIEAKEELFYIQALSAFRKSNVIDPIQASFTQSNLISNILAANYGEEMNLLNNVR